MSKTAVNCFATVDLDSVLEEIHDSWSDKDRYELVRDLCYGFEDPEAAYKKLKRLFSRELGVEISKC